MTKAIRCFSNVTLLPLPPYSPELNPVEQLWQQIKQRFLSNTTFVTYSVTYIETGSAKAAQSAGLSAALFMGIGGLRGR
jgi:hypothetical protein